jgi:uncharacterized Fe-S cluster-containing radical SAM superfamily protein
MEFAFVPDSHAQTLPILAQAPAPDVSGFPSQPFFHLDALWIQVEGSRCNLNCKHCFVSSGPEADHHERMSRAEVAARVSEALALSVKEIYFTGGEPFLHPDLVPILGDTLERAPATVLTNGTLFTAGRIEELRGLSDRSRFSLEIRVSLDGGTAAEHDAIRGAGTFARTLDGLGRLSAAGLLPIVTVTQLTDEDPRGFQDRCLAMLQETGLARPRLKVLPLFRLGRESQRDRGYRDTESLAGLAGADFDPHRLQCGSSRAVTSRGVFVCPLLVDEPAARMGERLEQTAGPFVLRHGACHTCYATGMTCGNG